MRLVSIGVTRNESEILEAHIRHHCALFDEMVLIVNRCSDNTEEMLSALIHEGLPVRVLAESHGDGEVGGITPMGTSPALHKFSGLLTDLMRDEAQRGADWVFPLDVDEFLALPGRSALEEILQAADPASAVNMPWVRYVPTPEDDENEPHVLRRIVHRSTGKAGQTRCKVAVPRLAAMRQNVMLGTGGQFLIDPVTTEHIRGRPSPTIALAHFPVRDERQLRNRIISAHLHFRSSPLSGHGHEEAQGKLWKRCIDPTPVGRAELREIAINYRFDEPISDASLVVEPVTVLSPELSYPVRSLSTWDLLIESTAHLAERLGTHAERAFATALERLAIGERTP